MPKTIQISHVKGKMLEPLRFEKSEGEYFMVKTKEKEPKFLNQFQLHQLLEDLNLGDEPNWDWMILIVAKTGLRFSEALALTPKDFDFANQVLSVSKTWNYKEGGGYAPTKNKSSVREVRIDGQLVTKVSALVKDLPEDKPIFVKEGKIIDNSTPNNCLARHCMKLGIPVISMHGLRHTHELMHICRGQYKYPM